MLQMAMPSAGALGVGEGLLESGRAGGEWGMAGCAGKGGGGDP